MSRELTVPEVRKQLSSIARILREAATNIDGLEAQLHRAKVRKRAAPTSAKMTDELADAIRRKAKQRPEWSQATLGRWAGVNPGRVSEALRGKRGER